MRAVRLALKLTRHCPGRCLYCEERKRMGRTRGARVMPEALLRACETMLRRATGHPFEEVHLTGGEISMRPDIHAIAARLHAAGATLTAATSGWAGPRGGWEELLAHTPFRKLCISLDHAEPLRHDAVRGPGGWARATRAIHEAVQTRERTGLPEVTVVTVVHRRNVRHLDALAAQLRAWKVDRWLPALLEGTARHPELALTSSDMEWLENRLREERLDPVLAAALSPETVPRRLLTHGEWPEEHPVPPCNTLGRLAILHPGGALYGCYGSEHEELEPIGHAHALEHMDIAAMLRAAAGTRPSACRRCPEPLQHSQPLR